MIISQTPYRVSFAGGGTDLPAFYEQEVGAVLSVAIKQHMYVTVSPRFDITTRVAYTKVEIAANIDELQHELAREALRMTDLGKYLEITTIGDVPGGTGMGSSSSLTVGLLNALWAYKGQISSARRLAEQSCDIEINILGKPIGRQDQYAAAFGGLNYIEFRSNDEVSVEPVTHRPGFLNELEQRVLIVYTQQQRSADGILEKQSSGTREKMSVLRQMRDLAQEMRTVVAGRGDLDEFARLLHEGWELKRSLGFGIETQMVNEWYEKARGAGAQGGKLLGAGGGGFLLLVAPKERHVAIKRALGHPRELPFEIEPRGSRIIFISDRYSF